MTIITVAEIREAERYHFTSWGEDFHLSNAYLLGQEERADYIAWLNQDGPADVESYSPY